MSNGRRTDKYYSGIFGRQKRNTPCLTVNDSKSAKCVEERDRNNRKTTRVRHPQSTTRRAGSMKAPKNRFLLKSKADQYKVMRYTAGEKARLEIPLTHRDHVQNAANIFLELGEIFSDLARRKQSSASRIIDARITLKGASGTLKKYAQDDMLYLREQSIWDFDNQ